MKTQDMGATEENGKMQKIVTDLNSKAALKQVVYQNTIELFEVMKSAAADVVNDLNTRIQDTAKDVDVSLVEMGDYEFHVKFGGDTMVLLMHTNVFKFPDKHHINKTAYIKGNDDLAYFGMVQMYNFLSDSLKYNRLRDMGTQLARVFINCENHFYAEGKRQLGFLYKNPAKNEVSLDSAKEIIKQGMMYCIDFDLFVPPLNAFEQISVEQKNYFNNPSGIPTGKRLGFKS
jgi:hypothetical protein